MARTGAIRGTFLSRVAMAYFLLILLTLGVAALVILSAAARYYSAQLREAGDAHAQLAAESVAPLLASGLDGTALARQALSLARVTGTRVTVISPTGIVLADSRVPADRLENHAGRPEVRAALDGRIGRARRRSSTGEPAMYTAVPIRQDGTILGVARLAVSLAAQRQALAGLAWRIVALTVLGVVLSGLVGYHLARRLTEPVRAMSRQARAMAAGDFEARTYVPETAGELAALAGDLNYLAREFKVMLEKSAAERDEIEAVLAGLSDAVVVVDRQGRVILLNGAAEKAFMTRKEQALGRPLLEVARYHELWEAFTEALAARPAQRREIRVRTPAERVLEARVAPVRRASGEVAGAVGVLDDVTELRSLERVRTEFVANVSHELKTPVTSIRGFAETLLDGALADEKTARHFLEIIDRESTRLGRLVDDLLELSRIESHRVELRLEPVSLPELAAATVAFYAPAAGRRGVTLASLVPADLPTVMADYELIEQVLRNLVDNAVKYTPSGGQVRITAEAAPGAISVRVADTGQGIPSEHLPRVFERFYRVDRARSRELGGTGLGLSIVKHVVERHGGQVTVESEPGRGTTFTFTLPSQPGTFAEPS